MKASRASTGNRRNPETHKAIIKAASDLIQETGDLTFEEVARRSGAGKATIYRWWPQKIELFIEVYNSQFKTEEEPPDFGDMKKEIDFLVASTLRTWDESSPSGKAFLYLLTKLHNQYPNVREMRQRFMPKQREYFKKVLQKGLARGQLREGLDLDVVTDVLFGFTWHCLLSNQLDPEAVQLKQTMDIICYGICQPLPAG